jgi:hypothetical protein
LILKCDAFHFLRQQIDTVAATRELRRVRTEALPKMKGVLQSCGKRNGEARLTTDLSFHWRQLEFASNRCAMGID